MRLPPGYVFPDFANVGIAPPAPRGALAVAQRAAFVPAYGFYGPPLTRRRAYRTGLVNNFYLLPAGPAVPGPAFAVPTATQLIPDPYSPAG